MILVNKLAAGDCLVMTAALECLHKQYPAKYLTDVETSCNALYTNNPHVTKLKGEGQRLTMHYPLIHSCGSKNVHFIQGHIEYLAEQLKIKLDCNVNRPYLYLSEDEKLWTNQVAESTGYKGKYWIVNSGYKSDFTTKFWPFYQQVIDHYRGQIQFVQVGEASPTHHHKPLDGVISLVGKTDARQLIRLAYHASGGIGGESFLHHIFASFQKPFVCIASGMSPKTWQSYNTEVYLSMQGRLPCCSLAGCWKSKVVKEQGKNNCELPVFNMSDEPAAKCMIMINSQMVVEAIQSYYAGGLLTM